MQGNETYDGGTKLPYASRRHQECPANRPMPVGLIDQKVSLLGVAAANV
jgi:hypothetical protein